MNLFEFFNFVWKLVTNWRKSKCWKSKIKLRCNCEAFEFHATKYIVDIFENFHLCILPQWLNSKFVGKYVVNIHCTRHYSNELTWSSSSSIVNFRLSDIECFSNDAFDWVSWWNTVRWWCGGNKCDENYNNNTCHADSQCLSIQKLLNELLNFGCFACYLYIFFMHFRKNYQVIMLMSKSSILSHRRIENCASVSSMKIIISNSSQIVWKQWKFWKLISEIRKTLAVHCWSFIDCSIIWSDLIFHSSSNSRHIPRNTYQKYANIKLSDESCSISTRNAFQMIILYWSPFDKIA